MFGKGKAPFFSSLLILLPIEVIVITLLRLPPFPLLLPINKSPEDPIFGRQSSTGSTVSKLQSSLLVFQVIHKKLLFLVYTSMAYVPPHLRKGSKVQSAEELIPKFRKNLNLRSSGPKPNMDKSGRIVYAGNAISRWFAVGLNGKETDSLPPELLRRVPMEKIERRTGEKPLALVNCGLPKDDRASGDRSQKPWAYITENILQDLIGSSESVRNIIQEDGMNSKEIKPKLVARVGKVLFLPRRPSTWEEEPDKGSICEASLRQFKRVFNTNIPASYMEGVKDEVVPKIGVEFKGLKDVFLVKLSDKSRLESTISCKCLVMKKQNRLELYKIELNPIRHMVYDISCIEKNLDLRIMLSTKRTLGCLFNNELESIRNLIASAVLDENSAGGLRWPLGKATSSENRFKVIGVWHTVSRVYESPLSRLKVRDADRFDFKTSSGEITREVTLALRGVASKLLEKKLESGSVSDMLEDTLKMFWENFLPHSNSS